jgi:hypothetical protein
MKCSARASEMKVNLHIQKAGTSLYQGSYDVSDAASFGAAFADVWTQLHDQRLAQASSIGALYEQLGEQPLDILHGAEIRLTRA